MLRALAGQIVALDAEIAARAKRDDGARRLMTIPGIGPLIATAIEALAPAGRDLPRRARLCRLGWADPAAAVDGRQAAARNNLQAWASAPCGAC